MSPTPRRSALVTGANRGIGLEVCRQLGALGLRVVLTGRDAAAAQEAAGRLKEEGFEVLAEVLDVASEASVAACAARLEGQGFQVSVLVNNAGAPLAVLPAGHFLPMELPDEVAAEVTRFL